MTENRRMEKEELERLMRKGFDFSVSYDITSRTWYGRKKTERVTENYHIEEPTLGTLDRMSHEFIKIEDLSELEKADNKEKMHAIVTRYTRTACRAIAYAVLGSEYIQIVKENGRIGERIAEKKVDEMVDIFMHCMTPTDLKNVTMYVLASRNLQDFLASIILMSESRTSHPDVIEGKALD